MNVNTYALYLLLNVIYKYEPELYFKVNQIFYNLNNE